MSKYRDLTGQKFGRLTCIKDVGRNKRWNRVWLCKCDCGNEVKVSSSDLIQGSIQSCGCLRAELLRKRRTKHGLSGTRLYNIWCDMKRRCMNPTRIAFDRYGGRGITVCDEWMEFEPFYKWAMENGYRDGLTLERINNDKGYSPDNCKWATHKEQARNMRTSIYLTYNGKKMTIAEWAEILGVKRETLWNRLNNLGWAIEKAITEPIKRRQIR